MKTPDVNRDDVGMEMLSHYFADTYKSTLGILVDPENPSEYVAMLIIGKETHVLVHPKTYVQIYDWALRICKNK